MKHVLQKFWTILAIKSHEWFFYAFLITSTLSVRKVLFYYPIAGSFNEYTGVYIYLSDIFLFLTLLFWLFSLCNNFNILSIITTTSSLLGKFKTKCSTWNIFITPKNAKAKPSMEGLAFQTKINVPRGTFSWLKNTYQQVIHNYLVIFTLFIAFFSFISILWSDNKYVALFRSIKLFEFVLLFFYILQNVPRGTFSNDKDSLTTNAKCSTPEKMFHVEHFMGHAWNILRNNLIIIISIGLLQSLIGIWQFIAQHSIGLFWLKESIISPNILGVAKVILHGKTYVRAYGLFPHPNILGGFLVFSIISTLLYLKMFHVEHFTRQVRNILFKTIVFIQAIALLLTFSKSAIIGLSIGLLYILIMNWEQNVPRGTFIENLCNFFKMFHVEHLFRKMFLLVSVVILFFAIIKPDTYSLVFKSLQERGFYLNVSRGTFLSHPLLGVGSGQFITNMAKNYKLDAWQYQPVHNVFLLVLNEFGIFVFFAFLYFIYKMFHLSTNVPRGTFYGAGVGHPTGQVCNIYFQLLLLSFLFIMLFDHYFWDIQQGQIMLWLILGELAATKRT